MTICLLSLGSNLKTPQRQLRLAINAIRQLPHTTLLAVAPFYRNAAWGKKAVPDYYNTVLRIHTTLRPFDLLTACQHIEQQQHRTRRSRYSARTLDIDILTYGTLIQIHPRLQLPHPRMQERPFVQVPLQALQPMFRSLV